MKSKNNQNKVTKWMICVLLLFCGMGMLHNTQTGKAAQKYKMGYSNEPLKIAGRSFQMESNQEENANGYRLVMISHGKKKVIASNCFYEYLTNGKVIYYVVQGKKVSDYEYRNTIYRYDIASQKKKKIIAGTEYTIRACNGRYLYCGNDRGAEGVDLYALNLKTGKKKFMTDGVGTVCLAGKKVVTDTNSGDAGNFPINVFKQNGTGKKLIAMGAGIKIKGNKINYLVIKYDKNEIKQKIYSCDFNGKHKKVLSGWLKTIPESYWKE